MSVIERLLEQLYAERDEINSAIRKLETNAETAERKPQRRKALPVQTKPGLTPCVHGCGKEFTHDGWRLKHETDCAFVIRPNGNGILGKAI